MKKIALAFLCFCCCQTSTVIGPDSSSVSLESGFAYGCAEEARIDTAYVDPISGHLKPPCSMSPNYCACLKARKFEGCK